MQEISIHALAKRATSLIPAITFPVRISIHALAKRATSVYQRRQKLILFQSTPSQRGRLASKVTLSDLDIFQSTPSQRGRLKYFVLYNIDLGFQSTPSQRGRRQTTGQEVLYNDISIHALAKRATANLYNDYLYFEAKYHISDIFPL